MKWPSVLHAAVIFVIPPAAPARAATFEASVQRMMDVFKKGDIAIAKAEHVSSPTIVDNVPPLSADDFAAPFEGMT